CNVLLVYCYDLLFLAATATTVIYILSLHDALPIFVLHHGEVGPARHGRKIGSRGGGNQATQPVVAFDKTRFFGVRLAGPETPSPVPAPSHPEPSALRKAIAALADHRSLGAHETAEAFGVVMRGEATPAEIAALLMGLRVKGETADEV